MIPQRRWFERQFALRLQVEEFPEVLERLRGTPARLTEGVLPLPTATLVRRPGQGWSIQENVGHLLDLEPLWRARLDDFLRGAPRLKVADLRNRRTFDANHNDRMLIDLLEGFRAARRELVSRLEELDERDLVREALHPRLEQAMNVVGFCFFVAEHDDHHLATIRALERSASPAPRTS